MGGGVSLASTYAVEAESKLPQDLSDLKWGPSDAALKEVQRVRKRLHEFAVGQPPRHIGPSTVH
jgi:hypothetical protein